MKRDLELIRKILLEIEEMDNDEKIRDSDIIIEGYSENEIVYHVKLLIEAGYLNGGLFSTIGVKRCPYIVKGLTWEGHDFIGMAKNDKVWEKGMDNLKVVGKGIALEIVKEVLSGTMKKMLNIP